MKTPTTFVTCAFSLALLACTPSSSTAPRAVVETEILTPVSDPGMLVMSDAELGVRIFETSDPLHVRIMWGVVERSFDVPESWQGATLSTQQVITETDAPALLVGVRWGDEDYTFGRDHYLFVRRADGLHPVEDQTGLRLLTQNGTDGADSNAEDPLSVTLAHALVLNTSERRECEPSQAELTAVQHEWSLDGSEISLADARSMLSWSQRRTGERRLHITSDDVLAFAEPASQAPWGGCVGVEEGG